MPDIEVNETVSPAQTSLLRKDGHYTIEVRVRHACATPLDDLCVCARGAISSRLCFAQGAAINAYSRFKCGQPEHDGDEDLVEYFYVVMHHNTASGKSRRPRRPDEKEEWAECVNRLRSRYGDTIPVLWMPKTAEEAA